MAVKITVERRRVGEAENRPGACKSVLHHPSESAKDGRSFTLWGDNGGRSWPTLVEERNSLVVAAAPRLVAQSRLMGGTGCSRDFLRFLSRLCHGDGALCRVHHGKSGDLHSASAGLGGE